MRPMRRIGVGAVLVALVMLGAAATSSAFGRPRPPGPLLRAVRALAEQVQEGFLSVAGQLGGLQEQLGGLEDAQTRGLNGIQARMDDFSNELTRIGEICEEGIRPPVELPDLITRTFNGNEPLCVMDPDGRLQILVFNVGIAQAPASEIGVAAQADFYMETFPVPALDPGDVHTVWVPDPPFCDLEVGVCDGFGIFADVNEVVTESDEANNITQYLFRDCLLLPIP